MTASSRRLLQVDHVFACYGQMSVLRDISLYVDEGEIVCVIGPNGSGKSTIMTAIAGGLTPTSGTISLQGNNLVNLKPENIARMGLSFVPEGRHIFGTLTVLENLEIGSFMKRTRDGAAEINRVLQYFPRLRERIHSPAGRLSGGEQQMLAIGRALVARPRFIMVDEPSLGLAPKYIDQIYDILLEMRRTDRVTLLINEQSSKRILKYADRIYVLSTGEIKLHGTSEELRDGEAIRRAYFGFGEDSQPSRAV